MSSLFVVDSDRVDGSGMIIKGDAAEDLGNRSLVYLGGGGTWSLANADSTATMPAHGVTIGSISAGRKGVILVWGIVGLSTWTWVPGGILYASTTSGELTQTAPLGSGDQVQVVGSAISATFIFVNPSLELVEVS